MENYFCFVFTIYSPRDEFQECFSYTYLYMNKLRINKQQTKKNNKKEIKK